MNDFMKKLSNFLGGNTVLRSISQSSDMMLAVFFVVIIMMIIIPVTPGFIDALVGINFATCVSILMVSLYIAKAVQLSVFPSILLITTLFRLGIEISATRQILLHANAGHVIFAFGKVVVGGNFVVGGIIFLIITIVQFIVVTKGAERVAEVAARFTLDAMPGKQMSIDADMRSGIIDSTQARSLRLSLQKESQLYGAMDGAMKFVKGDVIAGMVIAVINIVGGLIIGVFMHGMSALQAAQTYAILSIGSGLVSQIPSLVISLTAGMVTTRVTSEKDDGNLGKDIFNQIFSHPKGILIASVLVLLMSFIRAFPAPLFITLGVILGLVSFSSFRKEKKEKEMQASQAAGGPAVIETKDGAVFRGGKDEYALTLPVMLEVGSYLAELIKKDREGGKFIEDRIPKMRFALYQDLGVKFPGVHVRTVSQTLEPEDYCIFLNEVPLVRGKVIRGHVLTNETEDNLRRYNIPYTKMKNVMNQPALWVDKQYKQILQNASIKYWEILDVLILHLSYFFKTHANEFLGIQEVRAIVEFVEKSFPDLVKEVTRLVPLQRLAEIFKRLIEEQISIRDLRSIFEALTDHAQSEKDVIILTEYVRTSLKRYISYKYSKGQSILPVYTLDHEIEDMIRGAIKQTSAGSYLALDPDSAQLILQAFRGTVKPTPPGGTGAIVLTQLDIRRFVRKFIEGEFPDIAVVSHQEIVPEIRIQPLGRIQL